MCISCSVYEIGDFRAWKPILWCRIKLYGAGPAVYLQAVTIPAFRIKVLNNPYLLYLADFLFLIIEFTQENFEYQFYSGISCIIYLIFYSQK